MTALINEKLLTIKRLEPKTILVREGIISDEMIFVINGCIRAWYNAEGQDITLQFFFEGDSVTSLESFLKDIPSMLNIETLEECEVGILKKSNFSDLIKTDSKIKEWFYETAIDKLFIHTNRLLSLLKDKPFHRYQQLLTERPEIFQRIPQRYIASYLAGFIKSDKKQEMICFLTIVIVALLTYF
jgi:CRP-like cAMP-binding protein